LAKNETRVYLEGLKKKAERDKQSAKEKMDVGQITIPNATEKYRKLKSAYEELKATVDHLVKTINAMKEDIALRDRQFIIQKNRSGNTVMAKFDDYIQRKAMAGTVEFDFEAETLRMQVQTQNDDENTIANDVRNLSGGERSYSTFCLLLALGHVVRYCIAYKKKQKKN
jgi:chromosome segregation ATPase